MAKRNTDTVPAMLTPGEFVMTDKAVENAGGPGFFYWLMNALDPSSKKPREDGYALGGTVSDNLLKRTEEGDYYIPAGKNILGQPTKDTMLHEIAQSVLGLEMGKGALRNLIQARKPKIKKALDKIQETGSSPKVGKKVAEDI